MRKLILGFVAAVLTVGPAMADDEETSADATFKSLDRNTDERLSKAEAAGDKMLTEHFAAVDADSDGYLTKREYTAHMKQMESASSEEKEY